MRKYNPSMRISCFSAASIALAFGMGCSMATLETTINDTGEKALDTGNSVWTGAGRLWPTGLWPVGTWVADYEEAERLSSDSGKGTLYLFTQTDLTRKDSLRDYLENPSNRGVAADSVTALLFQRNERDRRYAAQFGVYRAPAVIVVHADGTYHATQGSLSPEKVSAFVTESQPPGAAPNINPLIARNKGYAWIRDWESARQASQKSGKPVFVVLERWMSRDWDTLAPMIERREVHTRVANMIPCRPSTAWSTASSTASALGIKNLPAVAIVPAEGDPFVLELPTSYEAIVHFADQALQGTVTDAEP